MLAAFVVVHHSNRTEAKRAWIVQDKVDTWISDTTGTDICDKVVSKSLDQLYDLLFSNSNFYFNFQKDRGTTELDIGNWEEDDQ
jgi:hypothetical protein